MPWVVTREPPEGPRLAAALRARGLPAVALAATERAPLPWPDALSAQTPEDLWFLTSAYAARSVLGDGRVPVGARIAALAPATVRAVTTHGHTAAVSATGGAVALARAVLEAQAAWTHVASLRVLYPTSDAGLMQAEQLEAVALLEQRFPVVRAAVYTTRAAPRFADALAALPTRAVRAVVYSPSAARALLDAAIAARTHITDVVAVGASTVAALTCPARLVPAGADVVDFIAASPTPAPHIPIHKESP